MCVHRDAIAQCEWADRHGCLAAAEVSLRGHLAGMAAALRQRLASYVLRTLTSVGKLVAGAHASSSMFISSAS